MDQVKIMEDSLSKDWRSMACFTLFIFEYFDTNVPPIKIIILLELTTLTWRKLVMRDILCTLMAK